MKIVWHFRPSDASCKIQNGEFEKRHRNECVPIVFLILDFQFIFERKLSVGKNIILYF